LLLKKGNVILNNKDTVNILNGQSIFDYFKKYNLNKNGIYAPFNEAMCIGEVTADIFSAEFAICRCNAHHVTMEKYNEITLLPLKILFENNFSDIILWFDDDMFCQINLLTLLAYLDQINYRGNTTFNLVNHEFELVSSIDVDAQGYRELYKEVMVSKRMPQKVNLPLLENGIKLYFEYLKEENEITSYISQRSELQDDTLLQELLKSFRQYGLGDTQYMQLISKYK
jgi:hypothetical protein